MTTSNTFFTDATSFLMSSLKTVKGETISYQRGSGTPVSIAAIRGKSSFNLQLADGTIQQSDMIDFMILEADFSTLNDPQKNDTIIDSAGKKYQVLPAATGLPFFSLMDSERLVYRVHTKEIKA